MIQLIEGKGVGAGKSYQLLEMLMAHWTRGGTAFASESFHVKWEECKKYAMRRWGLILEDSQYHEVESDQIMRLHEHTPPGTEECPVLIAVDEAQDQLDVRDHQNKSKKDLFSWCCQSRHDDNDLIFVTQSSKNVDARIRRLATFTWSVRNAQNFTIQGLGNLSKVIRFFTLGLNDGFYFIRNQLDYDGETSIDVKWVKADRGLFKCYDSKSMKMSRKRLGVPIAKLQLKRKQGTKPMYKWIILVCAAVLISGAVTMCKRGGSFLSAGGGEDKPKAKSPVQMIGPATTATVGAYDIRHEPWLASVPGMMKTKSAVYRANAMSLDGFVLAIKDKVVKIAKPDGRTLYIVGEDYVTPAVTPSPTPAPGSRAGEHNATAPTPHTVEGKKW